MTVKLAEGFDIQDYLLNEETDFSAFFPACVAEDQGDGSLVPAVLAEIAKVKGMTQLAKDSGLSRQCLYKALSPKGNPSFETIFRISRALNMPLGGVSAAS